jgi:CHAT domain-containing protein
VILLPDPPFANIWLVTREKFAWHRVHDGSEFVPATGEMKFSPTSMRAETVARFRRGLDPAALLTGQAGDLFDLDFAYDIYHRLFGEIEADVRDKRHLLIVPSGPLTALPFALLTTERPADPKPGASLMSSYRDAAWLIRRHAITVLPSARSLDALRSLARKPWGPRPMIGFGDPVFDRAHAKREVASAPSPTRRPATDSYSDFWQGASVDRARLSQSLAPLPDTAAELVLVARSLSVPAADIHLGEDASETTVKRAPLADYRILYFATHGLVAGDVTELSEPSLALTLPEQASDLDDGLLTASEVAQLKLNADWVVLSACNTIAGDRPGADALSGLARAFFYAGARALLVTHWAVESASAARLTTTTFAQLTREPELGRAEALRRAMLAYLDDPANELNAYPAFWGPFTLIGEGGAP